MLAGPLHRQSSAAAAPDRPGPTGPWPDRPIDPRTPAVGLIRHEPWKHSLDTGAVQERENHYRRQTMKRNRILYSLLSIGAIGAFFGHGMWAVDGKKSFVTLFTGSFDHVLGVDVATNTATNWVKGIGWFDLAVAVVMALMLAGVLVGKGALYRLAYSPIAVVIYGWGVLWGFATAASRVTAVGDFYPEIWDVVERAPNFMLPAALIWLIYQHRLDHRPTTTTSGAVQARPQLTK
jgi:hypothetical protein